MDPVTIALLAGTAVKGISSLVKGIKGRKDQKSGEAEMNKALANIKYSRPEEYNQIMGILKQRTGGINTRREMAEGAVRRSTSSGIAGIRQLADSPVAALGAYGGMKEREQNAIADLQLQFEGMRDEAMLGEVKGLQMGADYSDKEQYYNDMYKNMVKANLGASKMEAGRNMAWQGFEGIGAAALDFAGTKSDLSGQMNRSLTIPETTGTSTDPVPGDGGSLANM
jgi:hypothetical protein